MFRYDIRPFNGHYLGNISNMAVHLTFNTGDTAGFTADILDILQDTGVQAAFFVTREFVVAEPLLARRMKLEGHIVGSNGGSVRDMTTMTDSDIASFLQDKGQLFFNSTGQHMDRYFRFPNGVYSMRTLRAVHEQGFRTAFWSLSHRDWDIYTQPGQTAAFNAVINNMHNGGILLLHTISESNRDALADIIARVRFMGFEFLPLSDVRWSD